MTTAESLEKELLQEFGPYAPISRVWQRLSFPSPDAARKAALRGTAPIECLALPHRRGRFVRTSELAQWLCQAMGGRGNH